MRIKILVPDREDFNQLVREINQIAAIYLQSERRRFFTTDDLPENTHADLQARGITIIPDGQYDIN